MHRRWGQEQLVTWRERWWEFVDLSYEGLERFWRTLQFLWTWLKSKPSLLRYGSVAVSVLMGYALGVLFRGSVSPQTLLLLFLPGVLLGAVAGGMLAGTLSSLLGALVCQGYLIGPIRGSTPAPGDGLAILLYLIASAMILGLYRVQERQKQEIRSFADRLESRVRERTAELRAANEDLQGFCYSIAHDLRAPMRNLTSSTRMIIEDVGDKLEGDAKDNLLSLGASASRLSQLVDDLLAHARLTSAELKARRLNLSDLAEEVAQELLAEPWLCRVSIRIEPRIIVQGDRTLLKMALRNLMENSCKYSTPGQSLVIHLGEQRRNGRSVYFLRDNGIGFEQQYEPKIFQPFQRLHRDVEYSGTGIGLANVKRIIERHGGEVWAEGSPGEGAIFYFTIAQAHAEAVARPAIEMA